MHPVATICLAAVFASLAFGQTPAAPASDRAFYLTHADTPDESQEINNIVRAMTDTAASFDETRKTLTVHGNTAQLALADWLISELDRTAAPPPPSAVQPYRNDRGQAEEVRVFNLLHANTPLQLQELTNVIRSLSDMQRVFPYSSLKVLVARGAAEQMRIADWLVQQLDRPPGTPPQDANATRDIPWGFKATHTVRVFYLTHGQSPQDTQAIIGQLRTGAKIERLNPYAAQHAIAARGTADQIAAVDRLLRDLDQSSH